MRIDDLVQARAVRSRTRGRRRFANSAIRRAARRRALREGLTVERQRTLARLVSELRQDATFGARLLRRSPGFSTVAILTLAFAIGGNTAIFSLVNALALKPLPVARPGRSRPHLHRSKARRPGSTIRTSLRAATVFTDVAAHAGTTRDAEYRRQHARLVRRNDVDELLHDARRAGAFSAAPTFPSDARADVVVLAERTWRTRFASDPSIVGRTNPARRTPVRSHRRHAAWFSRRAAARHS